MTSSPLLPRWLISVNRRSSGSLSPFYMLLRSSRFLGTPTTSSLSTSIRQHRNRNMSGVIQQRIQDKLRTQLQPTFLDVVNESYKHSVPKGSESHFKVTVVSPQFKGVSLLEQQRMVFKVLDEEMKTGVHALSLNTKTPEQWEKNQRIHETPNCLGGSKHDSH